MYCLTHDPLCVCVSTAETLTFTANTVSPSTRPRVDAVSAETLMSQVPFQYVFDTWHRC